MQDERSLVLLLVDPDPVSAASGRLKYELDGYDVAVAASGEEALGAVAALRPDLLVVNLHRREPAGLQALLALEAEPSTRSLPLVVLEAGDREQAAELRAYMAAGHHAIPSRLPARR